MDGYPNAFSQGEPTPGRRPGLGASGRPMNRGSEGVEWTGLGALSLFVSLS